MEWFKRLYMGTWQFGGQFKQLSRSQIETLLNLALQFGIHRFDTAAVYGDGKVEEILGTCLPPAAIVVTKIPATSKPPLYLPAPIYNFYTPTLIHRSMEESLKRLRRNSIDTVLLHNWHSSWSLDAIEIIAALDDLKKSGLVKQIGISLPNDFNAYINDAILPYLDIIEAPFNPRQRWILNQLPKLFQLKKEVLLRSLFQQGKLLKKGYTAKEILQEVLPLNTSVVIGMTTEEQIRENISILKGGE
jgi:aryl-alcohol dehydrogenase-like predicted oxidoreductase